MLYVLVSMAELSAIGTFIQFWWPEIPTWLTALAFFLLMNGINLVNVKFFGERIYIFHGQDHCHFKHDRIRDLSAV